MTDIYGDALRKRWEMVVRQLTERPPDGKYVARLRDARISMSGSGNPMIVWEWEISTGDYAGYILRDFDGLANERSPEMVARKLLTMGVIPPKSLDDLESTLAQLVSADHSYTIQIRTNGDFTGVRVLGRTGAPTRTERRAEELPLEAPSAVTGSSLFSSKEIPPVEGETAPDTIEGDPFADPLDTSGSNRPPEEEERLLPGTLILLKDGIRGQVITRSGDKVICRIQGKLRTISPDDIEEILTGGTP